LEEPVVVVNWTPVMLHGGNVIGNVPLTDPSEPDVGVNAAALAPLAP
jgi:hypothetical protein